jgi:hypothetical protein
VRAFKEQPPNTKEVYDLVKGKTIKNKKAVCYHDKRLFNTVLLN